MNPRLQKLNLKDKNSIELLTLWRDANESEYQENFLQPLLQDHPVFKPFFVPTSTTIESFLLFDPIKEMETNIRNKGRAIYSYQNQINTMHTEKSPLLAPAQNLLRQAQLEFEFYVNDYRERNLYVVSRIVLAMPEVAKRADVSIQDAMRDPQLRDKVYGKMYVHKENALQSVDIFVENAMRAYHVEIAQEQLLHAQGVPKVGLELTERDVIGFGNISWDYHLRHIDRVFGK